MEFKKEIKSIKCLLLNRSPRLTMKNLESGEIFYLRSYHSIFDKAIPGEIYEIYRRDLGFIDWRKLTNGTN
jgi:hypothetical protein